MADSNQSTNGGGKRSGDTKISSLMQGSSAADRIDDLERRLAASDRRPAPGRAFGRSVLKLLPWEVAHLANNLPTPMWYADDPGLRMLFPVSGALFVAWVATTALRADRRGPHDLLSGTWVVRVTGPVR